MRAEGLDNGECVDFALSNIPDFGFEGENPALLEAYVNFFNNSYLTVALGAKSLVRFCTDPGFWQLYLFLIV